MHEAELCRWDPSQLSINPGFQCGPQCYMTITSAQKSGMRSARHQVPPPKHQISNPLYHVNTIALNQS